MFVKSTFCVLFLSGLRIAKRKVTQLVAHIGRKFRHYGSSFLTKAVYWPMILITLRLHQLRIDLIILLNRIRGDNCLRGWETFLVATICHKIPVLYWFTTTIQFLCYKKNLWWISFVSGCWWTTDTNYTQWLLYIHRDILVKVYHIRIIQWLTSVRVISGSHFLPQNTNAAGRRLLYNRCHSIQSSQHLGFQLKQHHGEM